MREKKTALSIWMILIFGLVCIIFFNKKNGNLAPYSIMKKGIGINIMEKGRYGTKKDEIWLDYPGKISYPEMKQFGILISIYPANAIYCKISADLGSITPNKIYLEKENQIIYHFPDDFNELMFESILFEFYDENAKLIENTEINIAYIEDEKQFQIIEVK